MKKRRFVMGIIDRKFAIMMLVLLAVILFAVVGTEYRLKNAPPKQEDSFREEVSQEDSAFRTEIETFLEGEFIRVFSPYYEVLGFEIEDFKEEDGKASFVYKFHYKNYDKDPDTVGYIKQAKEENSPHYETLKREYLEPKEMFLNLEAEKKDGEILLYIDEKIIGTGERAPFEVNDLVSK